MPRWVPERSFSRTKDSKAFRQMVSSPGEGAGHGGPSPRCYQSLTALPWLSVASPALPAALVASCCCPQASGSSCVAPGARQTLKILLVLTSPGYPQGSPILTGVRHPLSTPPSSLCTPLRSSCPCQESLGMPPAPFTPGTLSPTLGDPGGHPTSLSFMRVPPICASVSDISVSLVSPRASMTPARTSKCSHARLPGGLCQPLPGAELGAWDGADRPHSPAVVPRRPSTLRTRWMSS